MRKIYTKFKKIYKIHFNIYERYYGLINIFQHTWFRTSISYKASSRYSASGWVFTLRCESGVVRKEMGKAEAEVEYRKERWRRGWFRAGGEIRIMIRPRQWKWKGSSRLSGVLLFPLFAHLFSFVPSSLSFRDPVRYTVSCMLVKIKIWSLNTKLHINYYYYIYMLDFIVYSK